MKLFALRSVDLAGIPLGQEPVQLELSDEVINLIKNPNVNQADYKKIKEETKDVTYIAIDNKFFHLREGKLNRVDPALFTAESGRYHILIDNELECALQLEMAV